MSPAALLMGWLVAAMVPGLLGCREKEYTARDGQCCPMCLKGTIVVRDCTEDLGTRCGACKPGTFMNNPNGMAACFPCRICSRDHGLFVKQNCTATTDALCAVLSDHYCQSGEDETGCSHAVKHQSCRAGQRVKEAGTSRTDTVCEDCQPGYFSVDGRNCTAWTICSETEVKVREGSLQSDIVCSSAQRNHYSALLPVCIFMAGLIVIFGRALKPK